MSYLKFYSYLKNSNSYLNFIFRIKKFFVSLTVVGLEKFEIKFRKNVENIFFKNQNQINRFCIEKFGRLIV